MFKEDSFTRRAGEQKGIHQVPRDAGVATVDAPKPDILAHRVIRLGKGTPGFVEGHPASMLMIGSGAIMDAILEKMSNDVQNDSLEEAVRPLPTDLFIPVAVRNGWNPSIAPEQAQTKIVVVAMDDHPEQLPLEFLLSLRAQGVPVVDAASYYEEISGRIPVEHIRSTDLIFGYGFVRSSYGRILKQWMDRGLSILGGLLALPLFLILPLWIKWDSKGPVFYRQERVGWKGRRFDILKFRTMVDSAEAVSGPAYAEENDSRVTRVGRILRKFRLDELPQLINILKGDMSFVGPRPERPYFVRRLCREIPYYNLRSSVKPGLTGWAQILSHYAATPQENLDKFGYDLYYIKHMSVLFDLAIIMDTLRVVLTRHGAR